MIGQDLDVFAAYRTQDVKKVIQLMDGHSSAGTLPAISIMAGVLNEIGVQSLTDVRHRCLCCGGNGGCSSYIKQASVLTPKGEKPRGKQYQTLDPGNCI